MNTLLILILGPCAALLLRPTPKKLIWPLIRFDSGGLFLRRYAMPGQVGRRGIYLANETPGTSIMLYLPNQISTAAAKDSSWVQLSPFGDFGNASGSTRVLQRFRKEDADQICNTFNGAGRKIVQPLGMPFYIGHPDHPRFKGQPGHTDTASKGRGKEMAVRHNAECAACKAFANSKPGTDDQMGPCQEHGLFMRVDWNDEGKHLLANESFHGHSVNWRAVLDGKENGVQIYRPVALKSVGFTNEPNIPVKPASLANVAVDETSDGEIEQGKAVVPPGLKLIAGFKEDEDVTMEQVIEALKKAKEGVSAQTAETTAANEAATEAVGFFNWYKGELAKGYDAMPDCLRYATNTLLEYQENQGKLKAIMGEALANAEPVQPRSEGLAAAMGLLLLTNTEIGVPDEDEAKKTFVDQVHAMLGSDPAGGKAGALAALQEKVKKAGLVEHVKKAKDAAAKAYAAHDKARKDLEDCLANERKARATMAIDDLVKTGKVITKDRDARITDLVNIAADQFNVKLAEFGGGTTVIKTKPVAKDLANQHAKIATGERDRRSKFEELMAKRARQFPNETFEERWQAVGDSDEGLALLTQMNGSKGEN